jgi:hypothetical protein
VAVLRRGHDIYIVSFLSPYFFLFLSSLFIPFSLCFSLSFLSLLSFSLLFALSLYRFHHFFCVFFFFLFLLLSLSPSLITLFDLKDTVACLVAALRRWDPARISLPSIVQAQSWARQLELYEPHLRGCFAVADGMLVPLENDGRYSVQRAYYNGMDQMHAIKQINVFGIDGTLIANAINFPGSFADSTCTISLG